MDQVRRATQLAAVACDALPSTKRRQYLGELCGDDDAMVVALSPLLLSGYSIPTEPVRLAALLVVADIPETAFYEAVNRGYIGSDRGPVSPN